MLNLPQQSFRPNDLAVLHLKSDRLSVRTNDRTDGTTSFSHALKRASARQSTAYEQDQSPEQQPVTEPHRATRENEHRADRVEAVKEHGAPKTVADKPEHTDQSSTAGSQSASEAPGIPAGNADQTAAAATAPVSASSQSSGKAAGAAADNADQTAAAATAPQAAAATAPPSEEVAEQGAEVTVFGTGSSDDVKVSLEGLPAELLTALLAALGNDREAAGAVTSGIGTQADDAGNKTASLINALTEALQKKVSHVVRVDSGQMPITDLKTSGTLAQLLLKGAPDNGASTPNALVSAFKDFVSQLSTQDAEALAQGVANGSADLNELTGLSTVLNGTTELKLPQSAELIKTLLSKVEPTQSTDQIKTLLSKVEPTQSTDQIKTLLSKVEPTQSAELIKTLLSKVETTQGLPGVVQEVTGTAEKGTEFLSDANGKSGFAEQGATMQAGPQRQEPLTETSSTSSFGSIVADRLAAVAEQVGSRDKPLDVTLRLKMENGESLLVGLKDQAGKIMIQVKCADETLLSLLESQKETIVRHLEAKQISSSISVSPIEQDLTKRRGREQPKNTWGRHHEPPSHYIEKSI